MSNDDNQDTGAKKSQTMQAVVLNRLRDGLIEGALIPGQVISIRKFAAMFGTSPMPVRDALSQLVAANALQELPNRSVCVPVLTRERIEELFAVRAMLECRAARQACARATPELVATLRELHSHVDGIAMKQSATKHAVLRRNRKFHFTLYAGAQSEILMPLIESLWLQCGPTLFMTLETANATRAHDAHLQIINGMAARDPDMVASALEREIRETGETLLAGYDDLMSFGPLSFAMKAEDPLRL